MKLKELIQQFSDLGLSDDDEVLVYHRFTNDEGEQDQIILDLVSAERHLNTDEPVYVYFE